VTEPTVIHTHARNLISGCLLICSMCLPLNVALHAKCLRLMGNMGRWI